jgi:hypothetical protein
MADHSRKGPFVQAAVICEKVIEERDGTLTLVRIIDRYMTLATGPAAPTTMEPVTVQVAYVLSLRAGAARGRHTVTIELEKPSGQTERLLNRDVNFSAAHMVANLIVNAQLNCEHEGIYWISSLLGSPTDDAPGLLSRTSLEVRYERQQ